MEVAIRTVIATSIDPGILSVDTSDMHYPFAMMLTFVR